MARHPNRASESSRLRIIVCFVLFIAASIAVVAAIGSSRATGQHVEDNVFHLKIAPWVVEHTANGHQAEFFVVLAAQADLRPAATLATKAEKGRYVYDALRKKSQETQGPILQWLRERGMEHRLFYIVNAILVKGSRAAAEALANAMASPIERVMMMPPCAFKAPRAGPPAGMAAATARATRVASARLGVIRTARASGSCSACAMRSAAIHSARPRFDQTTISLGPA